MATQKSKKSNGFSDSEMAAINRYGKTNDNNNNSRSRNAFSESEQAAINKYNGSGDNGDALYKKTQQQSSGIQQKMKKINADTYVDKVSLSTLRMEIDSYRQNLERLQQYGYDTKSALAESKKLYSYLDTTSQYFGNFENEDAFKAYKQQQKERSDKLAYDLEAGQAEIDNLQSAQDAQKRMLEIRGDYTRKVQSNPMQEFNGVKRKAGESDEDYALRVVAADKEYNELNNLYRTAGNRYGNIGKALSEKRVKQREAADLQKYTQYEKEAMADPDFESLASTPTAKENQEGQSSFAANLARGIVYGTTPSAQRAENNEYQEKLDQLTDDEKKVYNYYINKGDYESARGYLSSLDDVLTQRQAQMYYEGMQGNLPLELAFAVVAGQDQFVSGLKNYTRYLTKSDDVAMPSAVAYADQLVSYELGYDEEKNEQKRNLGTTAYDALKAVSYMAPSMLTSYVVNQLLPGAGFTVLGHTFGAAELAGNAAMGVSIAGNAYAEMVRNGYGKDQASTYATINAITESALQYALGGISQLGGSVSGHLVERAATNLASHFDNAIFKIAVEYGTKIAGNMFSEGLEESIQEIIDPFFQNAIFGGNEKVDWGNVVYSGLLGAITAGMLESPGTIAEARNTVKSSNIVGKAMQTDGFTQKLKDLGSTFSADTVAYQIASKVDENTTSYDMLKLLEEVDGTLSVQNVNDIVEAMKAEGVTEKDARTVAEYAANLMTGDVKVTKEMIEALNLNTPLQNALYNTIINPNSTTYQKITGRNTTARELADTVAGVAEEQNAKRPINRLKNAITGRRNASQNSAPSTEETQRGEMQSTEGEAARQGSRESNSMPKAKNASQGEFDGNKSTSEPQQMKKVIGYETVKDDSGKSKQVSKVELADGTEALVTEANLSNTDSAYLTAASAFGTDAETTNAVISFAKANNISPENLIDLSSEYNLGYINAPDTALSSAGSKFSAGQKKFVRDLGKAARSRFDEVKRGEAKARRGSKSGGIVDETKEGLDNIDQKEISKKSIRTAEAISKAIGGEVHVFKSRKEGGKYVFDQSIEALGERGKEGSAAPNAWYDKETGDIYIDINAGNRGEGTMLYALSHEYTHFIRDMSVDAFNKLADFAVRELYGRGANVEQLVQNQINKAKANGRNISYDEAYEEFVADSMETMLTSEDMAEHLQHLYETDQKLHQKLLNAVKKFYKAFKESYQEYKNLDYKNRTAESYEMLKLSKESYRQIAKLYAECLKVAAGEYNGKFAEAGADVIANLTAEEANDITYIDDVASSELSFSDRVTDKEMLDFLDNQETVTTYKTMQIVDGKLYPPMGAVVKGSYEAASELGKWEQATEHPELIKVDKSGKAKFVLNKGKGQGTLQAAYNPYLHSSNLVLNDQFTSAYKRDNLVTVECAVPVSELTSGYHAEYAKDSVGWHDWHAGTVASNLPNNVKRQVLLSRWLKPVRIVPDAEVAEMYKQLLDGTDVSVPSNVVTPSLLSELEKAGVPIKYTTVTEATGTETVKFSDRIEDYADYDKSITIDDIKKLRTLFPTRKSISSFSDEEIKATAKWAHKYFQQMGTKSPFFRAWFGDWRAHDGSSVVVSDIPTVSDDALKEFIKSQRSIGGIENADTKRENEQGWIIRISGDGQDNTLSHSGKERLSYKALTGIQELVRNAILLDSETHDIHKEKAKNTGTDTIAFDHKLYALGRNDSGEISLYRVTVEEKFQDRKHTNDMRFHNLIHIEKVADNIAGRTGDNNPSHGSRYNVSTTNYTVADLYSFVKQYDKDFVSGKEVSTAVLNEDGTPKVFYHGTSERFNIFDPEEMAPREGSFFFSESRLDAESYGQNVMGVYLTGSNLADYDNMPYEFYALKTKREQVKWLKDRGYDGWYSDMDSGGFGEVSVFSNTQIKSATENIGPFNRSDADIRFSDRDPELVKRQNEVAAAISKENAKLSEENKYLKELVKLQGQITGGKKVTRTSLDKIAGHIMNEAGVRGNKAEFTKLINDVYEYIAGGEGVSIETIRDKAQAAIDWLQENATRKAELSQEAQDVFKHMRNSRVYVDDATKAEIKNFYGDYNGFRKAMLGRMTFTSDPSAISLDSWWQEAAEMFPSVFDADTNPLDMPQELFNTVEALNTSTSEDYAFQGEMDRQAMFNLIYDGYWDAATLRTVADRYQKQINKLRAQHKNRIAEVRQMHEAKDRQLAKEYNKQKQQALYKQRARFESKLQEQKDYYKDMRHRNTEERNKTTVRNKIKKLHADMTSKLLAPKVNKYIPAQFARSVSTFLDSINMNTVSERRIAELRQQIENTNGEKTRQMLQAQLDRMLEKSGRLSEKLAVLKAEYDAIKNDPRYGNAYDEDISALIESLRQRAGDTPIADMTLDQLNDTYTLMKAMNHYCMDSIRAKSFDEERTAAELSRKATQEVNDIDGNKARFLSRRVFASNSPRTALKRLGGFAKNSVFQKVYESFNNAQLKMLRIQMEANNYYSDLFSRDNYKNLKSLSKYKANDLVDIGLKDEKGNPVKITRGMMLAVRMALNHEDNVKHIMNGGYTVPNVEAYYKGSDAYGNGTVDVRGIAPESARIGEQIRELDAVKKHAEETGDVETMTKTAQQLEELYEKLDETYAAGEQYISNLTKNIDDLLTDYEKDFISATEQMFKYVQEELNATSMDMYGFEKFNVSYYFPIHTDAKFRDANFESIKRDFSLENSGFTKERVQAANPILLEDITDVVNRHINNASRYAAFVRPLHDFNKIYGKSAPGYELSLQSAVARKFGNRSKDGFAPTGTEYIEHLIADINGSRSQPATIFDRARGFMAGATLTLNPRVTFVQAASFPSAAPVVGWKALSKATKYFVKPLPKGTMELINRYSPMMWDRTKGGGSSIELGNASDVNSLQSKANRNFNWLLGWISAMDAHTVGALWYASQYYVVDNFNLEKGTDEYYMKVAEVFNETVERTQPMYSTMQRPDILRSPNSVIKMFTMFMTQRLQNFNLVYDSVATYNRYRKDLAAGKNGVTGEDLQNARSEMTRTLISQAIAAGMIAAIKLGADALLHSMNAYRDDDDELTDKSVWGQVINNFVESLVGMFLFGSEVYDAASSIFSKKPYYGIELSGLNQFFDVISNFIEVTQVDRSKDGWQQKMYKKCEKLADSMSIVLGIPVPNAKKIAKGLYYHIDDIVNGKFGSFEAGVDRTTSQEKHRLFNAIDSNDQDGIEYMRSQLGDDFNKFAKEGVKNAVMNKKVSEDKAVSYVASYAGESAEKAQKLVRYWVFKRDVSGYDWEQSKVDHWYDDLKDEGFTMDEYDQYIEVVRGLKGKENIVDAIDSLPISAHKKDVLYFMNNYAASTLYDAPWH